MIRRWFFGTFALSAVIITLSAGAPAWASVQPSRQLEYEAAILVNILRFATLPASAFTSPGQPFSICVPLDAPIGLALDPYESKTINERPIVIRRYGVGEMPSSCHALLLEETVQTETLPPHYFPIAMTSEVKPGLACVQLVRVGRQVRFSVDLGVAQRHDVSLSSRLLNLALHVR